MRDTILDVPGGFSREVAVMMSFNMGVMAYRMSEGWNEDQQAGSRRPDHFFRLEYTEVSRAFTWDGCWQASRICLFPVQDVHRWRWYSGKRRGRLVGLRLRVWTSKFAKLDAGMRVPLLPRAAYKDEFQHTTQLCLA